MAHEFQIKWHATKSSYRVAVYVYSPRSNRQVKVRASINSPLIGRVPSRREGVTWDIWRIRLVRNFSGIREGGLSTSDGREKDVGRSREGSYKLDSRHYDNPESVLRSTCQFSQTGGAGREGSVKASENTFYSPTRLHRDLISDRRKHTARKMYK